MGFFARTKSRAGHLFDQLKHSVQEFSNETTRDASDSVQQVGAAMHKKVSDSIDKADSAITMAADRMDDAIQKAKQDVTDRALRAREGVKVGANIMVEAVQKGAQSARDGMSSFAHGLSEKKDRMFRSLGQSVRNFAENTKDSAQHAGAAMHKKVSDSIDKVDSAITMAADRTGDALQSARDGMSSFAHGLSEKKDQMFQSLGQSVRNFAENTKDSAQHAGAAMHKKVGDSIDKVGSAMNSAGAGITTAAFMAAFAGMKAVDKTSDVMASAVMNSVDRVAFAVMDTGDAIRKAKQDVTDRALRAREGVKAGANIMVEAVKSLHSEAVVARTRLTEKKDRLFQAVADGHARAVDRAGDALQEAAYLTRQGVRSARDGMSSFAHGLSEKKDRLFQSLGQSARNFVEDAKDRRAERIVEKTRQSLSGQNLGVLSGIGRMYTGMGMAATAWVAVTASTASAGAAAGGVVLGGVALGGLAKTKSGLLDLALKRQITQDLKALGMEAGQAGCLAKEMVPLRKIEVWLDALDVERAKPHGDPARSTLPDLFDRAKQNHSPEGVVSGAMRAGGKSIFQWDNDSIGIRSIQTLQGMIPGAKRAVDETAKVLIHEMPEDTRNEIKVRGAVSRYAAELIGGVTDRLESVPVWEKDSATSIHDAMSRDYAMFVHETKHLDSAREMAGERLTRDAVVLPAHDGDRTPPLRYENQAQG